MDQVKKLACSRERKPGSAPKTGGQDAPPTVKVNDKIKRLYAYYSSEMVLTDGAIRKSHLPLTHKAITPICTSRLLLFKISLGNLHQSDKISA